MSEKLTRHQRLVSADRCKPKKCRQECEKGCPRRQNQVSKTTLNWPLLRPLIDFLTDA